MGYSTNRGAKYMRSKFALILQIMKYYKRYYNYAKNRPSNLEATVEGCLTAPWRSNRTSLTPNTPQNPGRTRKNINIEYQFQMLQQVQSQT